MHPSMQPLHTPPLCIPPCTPPHTSLHTPLLTPSVLPSVTPPCTLLCTHSMHPFTHPSTHPSAFGYVITVKLVFITCNMSGSPVHDLLTVSPPNLNLVRCDYETNWNCIGDCLIENEIDALLFAPFGEVIVHLLEECEKWEVDHSHQIWWDSEIAHHSIHTSLLCCILGTGSWHPLSSSSSLTLLVCGPWVHRQFADDKGYPWWIFCYCPLLRKPIYFCCLIMQNVMGIFYDTGSIIIQCVYAFLQFFHWSGWPHRKRTNGPVVRDEVCPLNQYYLLCFDNWNLTDEWCKVLNVVVKSGVEFRVYNLEPIFWQLVSFCPGTLLSCAICHSKVLVQIWLQSLWHFWVHRTHRGSSPN